MKQLLKILKFAGNLWPYYLAVMLFSVLLALANMVVPFAIKGITDIVVGALQGQQPDYWLGFWIAVALFLSDVASTVFSNVGGYYGDIMAIKLKKQLSERYYRHLML